MAEKDDFKLTQEEAKSLRKALKKEEFRKLLAEYAEEISNPENKKLYEEEIKRLEQERGVDVKFIHPKPGHVLKTCFIPSKKKLFVNICCSDLIDLATPNEREPGLLGTMWSIPYSVTPPRDDIDKAHNKISIIDVIFNGKTYEKGIQIPKFNDLMEATALDSIERDLKFKIDRKHVKRLKQPYKGTPHPAVIRKRTSQKIPENNDTFKVPYPPLKEEVEVHLDKAKPTTTNQNPKSITPKHTVVYRGEFDCLDYTLHPTNSSVKRPKEIVITVELPMLSSSADLEVDIHERLVILNHSDSSYNLEIPLSYPVNNEKSSARFIKSSSCLILTLPVVAGSHSTTNSDNHTNDNTLDEHCSDGSQDDTNKDILDKHYTFSSKNEETLSEHCTDSINKDIPNEVEHSTGNNYHTTDFQTLNDGGTADGQDVNTVSDEYNTVNDNHVITAKTGEWKCPAFIFRQDYESISFVLHVKEVKRSTLNSHYDQSWAHLTFRDKKYSCHYSFFVKFPSGCFIMPGDSFYKVSEENIVLTLKKQLSKDSSTNDNLWFSVNVGINSMKTEEKKFPTEDNLPEIIHSVHHTDHWDSIHSSSFTCQVKNLGDDKTAVSMSPCGTKNIKTNKEEPTCTCTVDKSTTAFMKPATPTFTNTLLFDLD